VACIRESFKSVEDVGRPRRLQEGHLGHLGANVEGPLQLSANGVDKITAGRNRSNIGRMTMNRRWNPVRNLTVTTRAYIVVALLAIIFVVFVFDWFAAKSPIPLNETLRVSYLEHYVELV
jgi:hypothetical protein